MGARTGLITDGSEAEEEEGKEKQDVKEAVRVMVQELELNSGMLTRCKWQLAPEVTLNAHCTCYSCFASWMKLETIRSFRWRECLRKLSPAATKASQFLSRLELRPSRMPTQAFNLQRIETQCPSGRDKIRLGSHQLTFYFGIFEPVVCVRKMLKPAEPAFTPRSVPGYSWLIILAELSLWDTSFDKSSTK